MLLVKLKMSTDVYHTTTSTTRDSSHKEKEISSMIYIREMSRIYLVFGKQRSDVAQDFAYS